MEAAIAQAKANSTTRKNPGGFEEAGSAFRRVLSLDTFDGLRFDLAKPMNQQFALTHSILLGTSLIPGGSNYAFGANLMDSNVGREHSLSCAPYTLVCTLLSMLTPLRNDPCRKWASVLSPLRVTAVPSHLLLYSCPPPLFRRTFGLAHCELYASVHF